MKKIQLFSATWCGPCKQVKPIIEEIKNENSDIEVEIIDILENHELAAEKGIRSVPTIIYYKDDKEVTRTNGVLTKSEILNKL